MNIQNVLSLWGLENAPTSLHAQRENAIHRVEANGGLALRVHRKGYRTNSELRSELEWMAAMADRGVSVPSPLPSTSGALLQILNDAQFDILTWLPGRTLSEAMSRTETDRQDVFYRLGQATAQMHLACDVWHPSQDFDRPS